MHKNWRFFLLGHVWLLPFTLGYALFCFAVYRARSWGFRNGVLIAIGGVKADGKSTRIWGKPGAQTIGAMTCFASTTEEARADLHAHENCHIVEAFIAGAIGQVVTPLVCLALSPGPAWGLALGGFLGAAGYSLAYGVCFLAIWISKGFGPWHDSYRANPLETLAYDRQAKYLAMTPDARAEVWT